MKVLFPDLLIGYRAKVARAKEHLDVLKASIDSFMLDGNAYSVIKEADAKAGKYLFRLKLHRQPPLVQWSLVIGDCMHNVRCALDHLFWALLLLKHPAGIKDPTVSFPILKDKTTFNGRKVKLEKWVGKDVATMIERMQPYNGAGPDNNALLFIHSSDIADKHRLLLPCLSVPVGTQVILKLVDDKTPVPQFPTEIVSGALEDNAKIAEIHVPPESVVDVDLNVSLNIIFESMVPDTYIVVPSLQQLIGVVESVASDFAPLFTGHGTPPGS